MGQERAGRHWKLAHGRSLVIGPRSLIMGILNVTPDSFSDGGRFGGVEAAMAHAERMIAEGADIIDVGGESTRPGAVAIGGAEERARVLPVIAALARRGGAILSVDTYRAETAEAAIAAGAHIVNDVWGLRHESGGMADAAARSGAGVVVTHTGRGRDTLPDLIDDQAFFLDGSLALARRAGIAEESIVLDPGFGFGAAKGGAGDVELIARFDELKRFGLPLLAGTSRKRFLGGLTGREAKERDAATAGTSAILRLKGADIFRVHDVASNRDALAVADAVMAYRRT